MILEMFRCVCLRRFRVVTVLFSNANVVCGVFFFSDSGCELVEPQTFSLSSKREAIVLESQGNMNVEGALVKASLVDMARPSVGRRQPWKLMTHGYFWSLMLFMLGRGGAGDVHIKFDRC